ncbi:phosphatase PAP2 family protein [Mucilaginibacter sp.]|uniref:phosphatase PAP2 family protein n=1 Tax=Mucilaginibacter sp. TaxID=1882438 RepID=UPI003568F11B
MKTHQKRRFLSILIVLQLFMAAPFAAKVFGQSQLQRFDDNIMLDLAAHRTPEETGVMLFLSNTYRYGDVGIPAALLVGGIIRNDSQMRQNALYVASSTAISYGLTLLIKHIVKRPRPFVQNVKIIPVYRAGSTSFPSGHASSTFATATALSSAYPKWYVIAPAMLWAGSVSYSRMYLGVHYPTDVAAGAILGSGTALLLQPIKR